jgi:Arrestin (or S-antigen), C-terminal domain
VEIPKKGFVSGEILPVSAEIDNHSFKPIHSTSAKLVQVKIL